jgi:uncharacterized membrane-anchored protein
MDIQRALSCLCDTATMRTARLDTVEAVATRRVWNKVPEVTVYFWIVKVLATTIGQSGIDALHFKAGLGLVGLTVALTLACGLALLVQFGGKRYAPWRYWPTVILVSVVARLLTDNLVENAGIPLQITAFVFAVALAVTFTAWFAVERTLSLHTIVTPRREAFYWTAILFTFALGTAGGDLLAQRLDLGYLLPAGIFATATAVIAVAHQGRVFGPLFAFWSAYLVTRPLGASIADWLSQPRAVGGLGLRPVLHPSVICLICAVIVVAYLTRTGLDRPRLPDDELVDLPASSVEIRPAVHH